jgi:predicted branched-subunit amino acid permease
MGRQSSFAAGVRAGVPYAVAAFLLALSFGVVARPTLGAGATIVMSALVFAGSPSSRPRPSWRAAAAR